MMNVVMDVLFPVMVGAIGSVATILWAEIKTGKKMPWHIYFKYLCLGSISGFVAVNLLNPNGISSEKIPLAILAGLSPISYLKSQSIADGSAEDKSLSERLEEVKRLGDYGEMFEEELEAPVVEDEEKFVKGLKKRYNVPKGDDVDD